MQRLQCKENNDTSAMSAYISGSRRRSHVSSPSTPCSRVRLSGNLGSRASSMLKQQSADLPGFAIRYGCTSQSATRHQRRYTERKAKSIENAWGATTQLCLELRDQPNARLRFCRCSNAGIYQRHTCQIQRH